MRLNSKHESSWRRILSGLGVCTLLGATTGCQVDVGGQTLPSPWYQKDDIQYFPPGPEYKLSKEAAAQKAFSEGVQAEQGPVAVPSAVAPPVAIPPVPVPPGPSTP
jgi:hypothetical protein